MGASGRIGAGLRLALDGQVLGQRLMGDDDRCSMYAVLAAEALEALGDVDHELRVRVLPVHLAELGCGHVAVLVTLHALETGPQRRVATHDQRRHRLRDLGPEGEGKAQHPAPSRTAARALIVEKVTIWATWSAAITLGDVPDHLASAALVEVHVDVGHLLSARIQETFEEQVVADGVEIDDTRQYATQHPAADPRPGPTRDAGVARVADDVPDDEEVGSEAHLGDHAQLEVEPLGDFGGI